MRYKSFAVFTFTGIILSGCNLSNEKKNTFLALSNFTDPLFQAAPPRTANTSAHNETIDTDFAISEELARELKEAEALLSEPNISINN